MLSGLDYLVKLDWSWESAGNSGGYLHLFNHQEAYIHESDVNEAFVHELPSFSSRTILRIETGALGWKVDEIKMQ